MANIYSQFWKKTVQKIKTAAGYLYRHHFIRYLFTGGTTFIIFSSLILLLHHDGVRIPLATTISYWSSIIYNFSLNRWWTFSATESKRLHKHVISYGILLGVNYLFNLSFITLVSRYLPLFVTTVLSVGLQVTWTYPIYKNVIFKNTEVND